MCACVCKIMPYVSVTVYLHYMYVYILIHTYMHYIDVYFYLFAGGHGVAQPL